MSAERRGIQPIPASITERPNIPNVLALRYASTPMVTLWSPENTHRLHRAEWTEVMQGQHDLGIDIPQARIDRYRAAIDDINLGSIREREVALRHDENAMIEEFNAVAGEGYQDAHRQLTSRDVSDNVEQFQIKSGLQLIRERAVAAVANTTRLATETALLTYAGRTHNAPAQPDLVGKLFTNTAEEMLIAFKRMESFLEEYPMRGLKGAMGTQTDLLQLFEGDAEKVDALERRIADLFGFEHVMDSIGQVYPRSLDFAMVSTLKQLVAGPGSLAVTLRHMAGRDQFTEGFKEGQVGSSAMPHKMNARTLERIAALQAVLTGHLAMADAISGNQWYGGDVSNSATRRVFLPDSFYATDGLFQAYLTALDEGGFYPAVINAELEKYLPFLTTTRLLVVATQNGIGRETAHAAIKDHAKKAALEMRTKGKVSRALIDRLAADPRMKGVTKEQFGKALDNPIEFVGRAPEQITKIVAKTQQVIDKYPEEALYKHEEII